MDFGGLSGVDRSDLLRLADLLDAGLLKPPLQTLTLREHVAAASAAPLAECLAELTRQELPAAHMALVLRAFVDGARGTAGAAMPVEIVVSGPDATGGARDTGVVMRQLFNRARSRVMAVGFAVHQGKSVFQVLAERLDGEDAFRATLCVDIRRQPSDTSSKGTSCGDLPTDSLGTSGPAAGCPRCTTILVRSARQARRPVRCTRSVSSWTARRPL